MHGPHRTIWYELQARDWPFKNQAAEALIWQIGSGEGMKRVLASVSLGKEVTVSSHLCLEREVGLEGEGLASFTHLRTGTHPEAEICWAGPCCWLIDLCPLLPNRFSLYKTIVVKNN